MKHGQIIILNGAPRSGKSSIAQVIQETFEGPWINLGVDAYVRHITPPRYQPGIGLRPGGERPDLEPLIPLFYAALYESIAAHSRLGLSVVTDIGHHDSYTKPLDILTDCARRLNGLPVLFVGVRCSIKVIMQRRNAGQSGREGHYETATASAPIPPAVLRWQEAVHHPGLYDLEVDTSDKSTEDCVTAIALRLQQAPVHPTAFEELAAGH
ncbi:chloramphenicol 3-O phosphotransferase [Phyllobacterium myrsinacearum]|uniref:Chloramphenicol 3-O phosphotransferase n=2 Tax=Phyllobacterium myrsinacearum TaxID=28101 RepID=A0A839EBK2_9HYPH|nr:chloramphenicol phosphotransferase [Phyllobacterium myrsinacearum]MBA8877281.1 chloramphenicol 3-O phosphotransferase [Phyllobacterium myrsinacearum]